ncbi:hypothetical protein DPMN_148165 [Dreissena polymorpha]|uniref:Uncharacterized protein n=1 Tax=Dreissena polymorpha TaxID=45954 RepID=A0A9D4J3P9_DREPO|nr:hypothetical protein DPMN_148165 [Dreissena polymorpha]
MLHCEGSSTIDCLHESALCDVCCGDEACNYGDCKSIKKRLFNLWLNGKFDNTTLKTLP